MVSANSIENAAVVFDIGGVLLDVDQRYLYRQLTDDESAIDVFLRSVCSPSWNDEQDRGRSETEATAILERQHPEYRDWIRAFYGRHLDTIQGEVAGSVSCLQRLKRSGVAVYALSNWGRETFAQVQRVYGFLDLFDQVLVSGRVGMKKPDPEIYRLATDQFQLQDRRVLFVDDRIENLAPAREAGWSTHHFLSSDLLESELRERGWLV